MPAEHRRVRDVTQEEKKKQQEVARKHNTLHCLCLSGQEEVGGLWEARGVQNLRDTERPWPDEPHALVTDFILASLVSAELLTSS